MNPTTTIFHIRPDFDVAKTDATLFLPFVRSKTHPTKKPVKQILIGN